MDRQQLHLWCDNGAGVLLAHVDRERARIAEHRSALSTATVMNITCNLGWFSLELEKELRLAGLITDPRLTDPRRELARPPRAHPPAFPDTPPKWLFRRRAGVDTRGNRQ